MKILLIQPSDINIDAVTAEYKKYGLMKAVKKPVKFRAICLPPLGLLYVGSAIKRSNHEVRILDAFTLQLTRKEITQEVLEWKPDLVGMSVYSYFLRESYLLTESIKKALNVPIVLGGPHPSALPEQTLREFEHADFLMTGWTDFSIVDFMRFLNGEIDLKSVPGACFRDHDFIAMNSQPVFPSDLDEIPMPDRNLIEDMYHAGVYYNITTPSRKIDVLLTSRNCPFSCKFCQNLTGHKYLPHSPERVIKEIDYLVSRGSTSIEILDDIFTVNRARVEKIFDLIEARRYNLDFRIRSRVNLLDDALLKKFKRIGGRAVSYGMESGSDAVLKLMNKKTTVENNVAACRATKKNGLICQTTWIFGWPGETVQDIKATFRFIKKNLPTTFNLGVLVPLPGTPIYEEAKREGTLSSDWSVRNTSLPYIKTALWPDPIPLIRLLNQEILFVQINPRYVFQTMRLIVKTWNAALLKYAVRLCFYYARCFIDNIKNAFYRSFLRIVKI